MQGYRITVAIDLDKITDAPARTWAGSKDGLPQDIGELLARAGVPSEAVIMIKSEHGL